MNAMLLAQSDDAAAAAAGAAIGGIFLFIFLFEMAIAVATLAGLWKVFTKAGKPGWAAIVPIYNLIVLLEIVGRPLWWIALFICPPVGIVVGIIVMIDLAKKFGQGVGFAVGLILLGFVFLPILGFGDAQYQPAAK